jgi:hypothetical protein
LTVNGDDSTATKASESVGVNDAASTVAPPAAGTQEHLATKGATVVVLIVSQPVTATPAAVNLTLPAALAVATMIAGSKPNVVLPPVTTKVGVAGAAFADVPVTTPPTSASELITKPETIFLIYLLLLVR